MWLLFSIVSETSSERGSDEEAAIESLYEQDFQALRAECLRNNTLFTDPEFLPREEFLRERSKQYGNDIVWLRPSELCRPDMPILVSNKNEGFDIKPGLDSWFVPAFSAIADSTALLNHVIPPDQVGLRQSFFTLLSQSLILSGAGLFTARALCWHIPFSVLVWSLDRDCH